MSLVSRSRLEVRQQFTFINCVLIQHDAMNSNTAWGESRDTQACKHHNGISPHGTIQSKSSPTAHVERTIAAASDTCSSVSCSAELPLRLDTLRSAAPPRSPLRSPALCLCLPIVSECAVRQPASICATLYPREPVCYQPT